MMCAPDVDPATVQDIIRRGEAGGPYAININGGDRVIPRDIADALGIAKRAIAAGKTVDIGYMQVNSKTGAGLGYSVEDLFDPCLNLRAGSRVLSDFYAKAVLTYGEGQAALRAALSAYNTGDFQRGFSNGYVAKYYDAPLAAPLNMTAFRGPNPYTAPTSVPIPQEQNQDDQPKNDTAGDGGFRHDGTDDAGSTNHDGSSGSSVVGSL